MRSVSACCCALVSVSMLTLFSSFCVKAMILLMLSPPSMLVMRSSICSLACMTFTRFCSWFIIFGRLSSDFCTSGEDRSRFKLSKVGAISR